MSGTSNLLKEARSTLAALEEKIEEGRQAAKFAPTVRALITKLEGQSPNGKAKKGARMVWYRRPANCILPASTHAKGVSRKMANNGLCTSHASRLRNGTLSEEENEAYDDALEAHREKGNLK